MSDDYSFTKEEMDEAEQLRQTQQRAEVENARTTPPRKKAVFHHSGSLYGSKELDGTYERAERTEKAEARVKVMEAALAKLYLKAFAVVHSHPMPASSDESWPPEIGQLSAALAEALPLLAALGTKPQEPSDGD